MKIYHNNRCSKSRGAINLLNENNVQYEVIEYLKTPLNISELKQLISLLNIPPFELVRKGEEEYKEHFKGKFLSDTQWIEALVKYPKLIERPIVVNGNKAVVGRPIERILTIL